ncbi:hypothetical protein [Chromobacterium violaceum]|uniref:hypothetical protein n=1 Tax=Chromobacterium violaceum TaxID=536 RepID=UPI0015FA8249|nr:hypothetical protein [Chromobacterium violaceum]MBA8737296.1 hypothetical protein [Chromobacterium violaceum]
MRQNDPIGRRNGPGAFQLPAPIVSQVAGGGDRTFRKILAAAGDYLYPRDSENFQCWSE